MTSAHICAFRHVDNHILYTLAQRTVVSSCLQGRGSLSPSDSGRGGGAIRWYEKNTNGALEDKAFINGLLVNRLKVR